MADRPAGPLRRVLVWAVAAAVIQAVIAVMVANSPRFYGGVGVYNMHDDVRRYERYSTALLAGDVPYRDVHVEYPPLALPIFLVPSLGAPLGVSYRNAFIAWILVINGVVTGLVAWWVAHREGPSRIPLRLVWLTLLTTSLCPLLVLRYDLAPAALAFAAACSWFSGWTLSGAATAGAGVLVKVFPGVVAIPPAARLITNRGRGAAGIVTFAVCVATGLVLWLTLGGDGTLQSMRYHSERGVEIGSVYAGIAFAVQKAIGGTVAVEYLHASLELTTPWTVTLATLALPMQVLSLLAVAWRSAHSSRPDPMRDATAALLGYIAFGKVLSPQYLIWTLPFVAAIPGPLGCLARGLYGASCALTTWIYPWHFGRQTLGAIAALNIRNGLLVSLYILLLASTRSPHRSGSPVPAKH